MKKIFLFVLLLFSLLAISCVSANEIADNTTDSIMLIDEDNENLHSDNPNVISLDEEDDDYEIKYSDTYNNSYVNLTLPSDAKGNLSVSIGYGESKLEEFANVKLINGKASVKLPCLELKSYYFKAKYTGSDYIVSPIDKYITITPNIIMPEKVWINGDNYVSFELPDGITLTLYIYRDSDLATTTTIKNGSKIKLDNLSIGEFEYTFEYENEDYFGYSDEYSLEVFNISPDTKFNIHVPDILIGEDYVKVTADIPDFYRGSAKIIIDGNESGAIIADLFEGSGLEAYLDMSYLKSGVHNLEIKWENDTYFKDSTSTTTFNVAHIAINTDATYNYQPIDYIDGIYVEFVNDATGYVLLYIDGKLHSVCFAPDVYFDLDNLTTGKHDYEIIYSGDEKYSPYAKTGSFNIDYEIRFDSDANQIIMYLNNHVSGNLVVNINDNDYTIPITNGEAIFNIPVLAEGEYVLTVKYNGNELLSPKTFTKTISVEYEIIISDEYVNLTLPNNAQGNLHVEVYDEEDELLKTYDVELVDGKASVSLSNLNYGKYSIEATYIGDDYYVSSCESTITVENPNFINITLSPYEISFNQEYYMTIELPDDLSGKIEMRIGNQEWGTTFRVSNFDISLLDIYLDDKKLDIISEGNLYKVKIPTTKIGEQYLNFYYDDEIMSYDDEYDYDDYGILINIMPIKVNCPNTPEIYPIAKNKDIISVEMPNDTNGTLIVRLYDAINYKEDEYLEFKSNNTINGITSITLNNLVPKLYAMFLTYIDEKYGTYEDYQRLDVEYQTPEINIQRSNSNTFEFNLADDAKGEIVFVVENKVYYTKVINGSANISTSKLSIDNPEMSLYYSGDDKYAYTIKKIPVIKEKVVISSQDITTQYNVAKYLTANLKDVKGNVLSNAEVTILLNGESKTLKTDSNGQINLLVNLAPKTYSATIIFKGNDTYDSATINVNVVVKKSSPKLTAAKKTYKAKVKTKKYTITLKDNKSKAIKKAKVTLKVKGKTYKATTNAKGKATFKITKLTKKGTYKSTVKFTGNSYYNAISKTVKILVKK